MAQRCKPDGWFKQLTGFPEGDYATTKERLICHDGKLTSKVNNRTYDVGVFETPTLSELRDKAGPNLCGPGTLKVRHIAIMDILEAHAKEENAGALFQVASQLNCLEFPGPNVTPEDGVTDYVYDNTQGPACSLAAGPATIYRNYFADVDGQEGQTADRQINNLDLLESTVDNGKHKYWTVRNGYTNTKAERIRPLRDDIRKFDRDELLGTVKIGIHRGVEVTLAKRYVSPSHRQHVSQAFCSAVSCGYSTVSTYDWGPLARLVLDAAYEATLWAAVLNAAEWRGSNKVYLTFLGGGVFGNPEEWINEAIARALAVCDRANIEVVVCHHRQVDMGRVHAMEEARKAFLRRGGGDGGRSGRGAAAAAVGVGSLSANIGSGDAARAARMDDDTDSDGNDSGAEGDVGDWAGDGGAAEAIGIAFAAAAEVNEARQPASRQSTLDNFVIQKNPNYGRAPSAATATADTAFERDTDDGSDNESTSSSREMQRLRNQQGSPDHDMAPV